ncbi:hypothetical protein DHC50_19460 [Arenibacter sp. A80]|nr:hypothetical protein [Arenibacter sp. A80]RFT54634.1 hypothetical protein D0S24_19455 [Arenibacter sp. P308M17]
MGAKIQFNNIWHCSRNLFLILGIGEPSILERDAFGKRKNTASYRNNLTHLSKFFQELITPPIWPGWRYFYK